MSNYDSMRTLISSYSGQDRIITIPKIYIELTGDYNTATMLNQIIFWSDKSKRKDGFFYKTYQEWEEELMLSEYQVRRSVKKLEDDGIVETKLMRANGSPTRHYKLNFKVLQDSILKKLKNGDQSNLSIEPEVSKATITVDNHKNTTVDKESVEQSSQSDKSDAIPYLEIIEHLNKKTGKSIKHTANGNRRLIRARWNEGYTLEDFKKVIDNKSSEWMGVVFTRDGKNVPAENYLHPATLFIPKNFDRYLNEQQVTNDKKKPNGYSDTGALLDSFGSSYK